MKSENLGKSGAAEGSASCPGGADLKFGLLAGVVRNRRSSLGWVVVAALLDLASTLLFITAEGEHGVAHLIGSFVGYTFLSTPGVWPSRKSSQRWPSLLTVSVFGLLVRGGAVGTAIGIGAPALAADLAGIVVGWAMIGLSRYFLVASIRHSMLSPTDVLVRSAVALLVVAIVLRLVYVSTLPLLAQEAYYWNYAAHLDIGYFDHPPLIAWLIAAGQFIGGHSEAGIRLASLACGLIAIAFSYLLSLRLTDRHSALMVAALMAALPFLFGAGILATPDAPLIAAWSAALYFAHSALIMRNRSAWLSLGVAIGIGLLSKYTIVLLGVAVLVFVVVDRQSRRWLLRWEPYAGAALAIAVFAPVIVWNYQHDWASFLFQTRDRYGDTSFSLHVLAMNVLLVATPVPIFATLLLFMKRKGRTGHDVDDPPGLSSLQNRMFIACMIFVPLLIFVLNALRHEPRLNWTAPIWLAELPLAGWAVLHGEKLKGQLWGAAFFWRKAPAFVAAVLMINAAVCYYIVLGLPGVPYPNALARVIGWETATSQIQVVSDRLLRATGQAPVVVGMDKYFTASKISYYTAKLRAGGDVPPMSVTSSGAVFDGEGLMFEFWSDPVQLSGRAFIMVGRKKDDLRSPKLASYFRSMDPDIHQVPIAQDGPGSSGRFIANYYYRVGYDYRPQR